MGCRGHAAGDRPEGWCGRAEGRVRLPVPCWCHCQGRVLPSRPHAGKERLHIRLAVGDGHLREALVPQEGPEVVRKPGRPPPKPRSATKQCPPSRSYLTRPEKNTCMRLTAGEGGHLAMTSGALPAARVGWSARAQTRRTHSATGTCDARDPQKPSPAGHFLWDIQSGAVSR